MSAPTKRTHAGAAVAGLFERMTATGGLAGPPRDAPPLPAAESAREPRMRLGVELTERELGYLRELSRPARTGGPRTLGSKFVGTGVLAAAIELLGSVDVDLHGVTAGDLDEMVARARAALIRAATHSSDGGTT
jgi:hypothetical protein